MDSLDTMNDERMSNEHEDWECDPLTCSRCELLSDFEFWQRIEAKEKRKND